MMGIDKSIQLEPSVKKDEDFVNIVLKDETLTFAEKTLSIKRIDDEETIAYKDDIIVASSDLTMATDGTGPLAIKVFRELGDGDLFDPKRVLLVADHTFPASNERVALLQVMLRNFAFEKGAYYTEGNICHQYLLDVFDVPGSECRYPYLSPLFLYTNRF